MFLFEQSISSNSVQPNLPAANTARKSPSSDRTVQPQWRRYDRAYQVVVATKLSQPLFRFGLSAPHSAEALRSGTSKYTSGSFEGAIETSGT
jgi:hypothetical protein